MPILNTKSGFTLIELSIVLVIIALVVGGVLVGQDLISAAQVRKTIGQIETINSSVNAFRGKYNCLPGDCPNNNSLGLTELSLVTANPGNYPYFNNGKLDTNWECPRFWVHLESAGYIRQSSEGYGPNSNIGGYFVLGCGGYTMFGFYSIGLGTRISTPLFNNALPKLFIATIPGTEHDSWSYYDAGFGFDITPRNAFVLDSKLDDGLPWTGKVVTTCYDPYEDGCDSNETPQCMNEPSPGVYAYNLTSNNKACNLGIIPGF